MGMTFPRLRFGDSEKFDSIGYLILMVGCKAKSKIVNNMNKNKYFQSFILSGKVRIRF